MAGKGTGGGGWSELGAIAVVDATTGVTGLRIKNITTPSTTARTSPSSTKSRALDGLGGFATMPNEPRERPCIWASEAAETPESATDVRPARESPGRRDPESVKMPAATDGSSATVEKCSLGSQMRRKSAISERASAKRS